MNKRSKKKEMQKKESEELLLSKNIEFLGIVYDYF